MKEYIDKELFLSSMGLAGDETKYGNRDAEHQHRSYSTYMAYEILDSVDDAIADNVVERKRGEWVTVTYEVEDWGEMSDEKCSVCGFVEYYQHNFCPNCGADMRGEKNG